MKSTRIALALGLTLSALAAGCTTESVDDEAGAAEGASSATKLEVDDQEPKLVVGENLGATLELRACSAPPITYADLVAAYPDAVARAPHALENGKCRKGTALPAGAGSETYSYWGPAAGNKIYVSLRVQDAQWPRYSGTKATYWAMERGMALEAIDATAPSGMPKLSFFPDRDGTANTMPFWPTVYAEGIGSGAEFPHGVYDMEVFASAMPAASNRKLCADGATGMTSRDEFPAAGCANAQTEHFKFKFEILFGG